MRKQHNTKQEKRIRVRSIRLDPPDLRKLSRALIDLAMAQAEADAKAQHAESDPSDTVDHRNAVTSETVTETTDQQDDAGDARGVSS